MDHDAHQPECVCAIELVGKRVNRERAKYRIGRRQINEITRVGDRGPNRRLVDTRAKAPDLGALERFRAPPARVLGEDLDRFAAVHSGTVDSLRHPAGDRHVGANPKHGSIIADNM